MSGGRCSIALVLPSFALFSSRFSVKVDHSLCFIPVEFIFLIKPPTMPPRKTAKPDAKAAAAAAAANDLATEQDPLQAVILADSFNRRFDVLCVDKPRVSPRQRKTGKCSCIALVVLAAYVGCSAAGVDARELEFVEYHRSHHLLHCSCRCYTGIRRVRPVPLFDNEITNGIYAAPRHTTKHSTSNAYPTRSPAPPGTP